MLFRYQINNLVRNLSTNILQRSLILVIWPSHNTSHNNARKFGTQDKYLEILVLITSRITRDTTTGTFSGMQKDYLCPGIKLRLNPFRYGMDRPTLQNLNSIKNWDLHWCFLYIKFNIYMYLNKL